MQLKRKNKEKKGRKKRNHRKEEKMTERVKVLILNTLFLHERLVYKRHEPEICQNFKNKIRYCPG